MPPSPAASPLFLEQAFIVGRNEHACLLDGWHEREMRQPDCTPYRAIGRLAHFRLHLPAGSGLLKILLNAPVPNLGVPYQGRLLIGNSCLGEICMENDNWVLRAFSLPARSEARTVRLTLESDTAYVPARRFAGNTDSRTLAANIAAVVYAPD